MYEDALAQFNRSLQLKPVECAGDLQPPRSRVYQYQKPTGAGGRGACRRRLDARAEALAAAATSLAYQHMRKGELEKAIELLEAVIREDDSMRIRRSHARAVLCAGRAGGRRRRR